jgi:hypothetical protein
MDRFSPEISDLILCVCPLGCNEKCGRIWINKTIRHRIVCKCPCGHNKRQVALDSVDKHVSNVQVTCNDRPTEEDPSIVP